MKQDATLLQGGSYFHPSGKFIKADILLQNGKIKRISPNFDEGRCRKLDLHGRRIIPGFIDVHIQGAGGSDCQEGSAEALNTMSATLAREGTTSFLATTVMVPGENNEHLPAINEIMKHSLDGAHLLGTHLEGPFINPVKKGGIIPRAIGQSSPELFKKVLTLCGDSLKMMTIAPELEGNLDLIKELKKEGIIAAFGHSDADYEQTLAGIDAGISHITHLFNAMRPIHHREPGPLVALMETPGITAQVISDGKHIHPAVVRLAYNILGKDRITLITDGMSGLGLGDGYYEYIGRKYISENGTSRYPNGTLNGTTVGLNALTKRFCRFTGCAYEEAVAMGTSNPARLLGIYDSKGSIEEGKDADLVIIDSDNEVVTTFCSGRIAYTRE